MQRICPTCQEVCSATARFCEACGARLSPTRPELRAGTLLFCDVVGSARLANQLDPDDYNRAVAAFERAVRAVARRHEGYIDRVAGDGAFVVFGFPLAREDSAVSAVAAGLGLVRATQAIVTAAGGRMNLRVGIGSGRVVMDDIIASVAVSGRSITGVAANLAARLASAAEPGTVVVCEDTYRLVGEQIGWRPLGPLTLKSFDEPVAAWQAVQEREAVSRFDAVRPSGSPTDLIGREMALKAMSRHWTAINQGQGQGVLILGDAGIGKSRLARACVNQLHPEQSLYIDLQCSPRTRLSPLYPVGAALRRMAGIQRSDNDALCGDKAALLLRALIAPEGVTQAMSDLHDLFRPDDHDPTLPVLDSAELVRERSIAVLVDLILALTVDTPVFLLVEDLHWSDPSTQALLSRLLQNAPGRRLLVVITARESELQGGAELPNTTRLALGPLDAAGSLELVRRRASGGDLPDAVIDDIVNRGEGVPLFLEELTQSANSAFDLPASEPEPGADRVRMPALLQSLMQSRLDRMPDLKEALQTAAVLGREFPWPLLARVLGDTPAARDAIMRLIDTGALMPTESVASARLRFKHALIHEAVYDTLLRSDRQRRHSEVADLLMADPALRADHGLEQLAHHQAEAGRHRDAILCLLQASRTAAEKAAYVESIGHADRGLALLPQLTEAPLRRLMRLYLLAQKGVPMTALHGYAVPEVEQLFAEASELCSESTPIVDLYPVLRGLASYYFVRGQIERADRLAQQCLAIAQKAQRADLRICALSFAAYPAVYLGRLVEGDELSERAMALYRGELGQTLTYCTPQDPATAALAMITTTAWLRGDLQRADDAAQELLTHVERLRRPFDTAYGQVWLAASYQLQRRHALALQHAQPGLEAANRHGLGTWTPAAYMEVLIAQGVLAPSPEPAAQLQAVHQGFIHHGAEVAATFYQWGIALCKLAAGDRAGALAAAEVGIERARRGQETYLWHELLIARAHAQDDDEAARRDLISALDVALRQGAVTVALRAACELARRAEAGSGARERAVEAQALIDGGATRGLKAAQLRAHLDCVVDALGANFKGLPDTRWLTT